MFFKIKKLRTLASRAKIFFFASLLCYFSYFEQSMAGSYYSPYVSTLKDKLIDSLVENNVCKNREICREILHMYAEGTSRIYLNMYDQSDTELASHVAAFFIKEGLKITKGIPITLSTYPKPKDEYMNKGFKYAFGNDEYLINLEINK
jgi:hypothetical protein